MKRRDAKIAARRLRRMPWMIEIEVRHPLHPEVVALIPDSHRGYSVSAYHCGYGPVEITSRTMAGRSRAALAAAVLAPAVLTWRTP